MACACSAEISQPLLETFLQFGISRHLAIDPMRHAGIHGSGSIRARNDQIAQVLKRFLIALTEIRWAHVANRASAPAPAFRADDVAASGVSASKRRKGRGRRGGSYFDECGSSAVHTIEYMPSTSSAEPVSPTDVLPLCKPIVSL